MFATAAIGPAGAAIVTWARRSHHHYLVEARVRRAAGFAKTVDVSRGKSGYEPLGAIDRAGDALVAWTDPRDAVLVAARRAGGTFAKPQRLDVIAGNLLPDLSLAMDAGGDAILGWSDAARAKPPSSENVQSVKIALRNAGGKFKPPITLARDASGPSIAMNEAGDATICWTTEFPAADGAYATERKHGHPFSKPTRLPAGAGDAAIDRNGDSIIVWNAGESPTTTIRATLRPATRP